MNIEFYPEHDGNLDKEPENRVSVIISPMTVGENNTSKAQITFTKVKGYRDKLKDNSAEVIQGVFDRRVHGFKNLTCPMTKKPVLNVKDFNDSFCSSDLRIEIIDMIQDFSQLSQDQLKNSGPPSDSV